MPPIKSSSDAAFKKNVSAEIRSGRPRDQSLAIAFRVRRDAKRKKMANGGRIGYADGGGLWSDDPFTRAAQRQRQAVMPQGGRTEGAATKVLDSLGESIYNTAAKPSRIWGALNEMVPGQSLMDRPDIVDAVAQTSLDLVGMPGLASAVPRGAVGSAAGSLAPRLPMDEASRMARARELGFDVDNPRYVSLLQPIEAFEPHGKFMGHKGVSGISVTDNPAAAARYLDRYGDYDYKREPFQKNTMKVLIRPGNVREFGQPLRASVPMGAPLPENYKWPGSLDGIDTAVFPDRITKRGNVAHPADVPKGGVIDSNEYIMRDPSQVRSINAAFDPSNKDSGFLLGANATDAKTGAAVVAAGQQPFGALVPPAAAPSGIRAYHGSPHDFDRFDMSRIGTGEGAQAFGHGLYFAENPSTARAYRDSLSDLKPRAIEGKPELTVPSWVAKTIESRNPTAIGQIKTDFEGRLSEMRRQIADPNTMQPWNIETNIPGIESILRAVGEFEKGAKIAPAGRMYEVNINARPEQFLDWDKPLASQPQKLQELVANGPSYLGGNTTRGGQLASPFGEDIYRRLASAKAEAAPKVLNSSGIPGIKYLDQGSRGTGTGTSNYVVFDDKLIDILKKYGITLPGAGVAAGAAIQSEDQGFANGGTVSHPFEVRGYAAGGSLPFAAFQSARKLDKSGMVKSLGGGRTDSVPMGLPPSSYIIPADVISGIGQGNSLAGANAMNKMFKVGPYGASMPTAGKISGRRKFADGGMIDDEMPMMDQGPTEDGEVPIAASGGEYVLDAEKVAEIGGGDIEEGHAILDAFVKQIRKQNIKTLKSLPAPKK